ASWRISALVRRSSPLTISCRFRSTSCRTSATERSPCTVSPYRSVATEGAAEQEAEGGRNHQRRAGIVLHDGFHVGHHPPRFMCAHVLGRGAQAFGRRVRKLG